MNEEGSALQTLTEPMSVDQTDDNNMSVDVKNEHVTNNKDNINTIDEYNSKYEEIVNILLSNPKIESIPENEIMDTWKTNGIKNMKHSSQDDQNYSVKCNLCGIICNNEDSLMEHTVSHADIAGDNNILHGSDTNITTIESYSNSYEQDFNKSQSNNVEYKKLSPVWEFAEKINSEQSKCKLCYLIFSTKGGTTSNIRSHILLQHRDTDEGRKLRLLVENKKINRINKMSEHLTPNVTENTENLQEDMITYIDEQYQCKVCGNTEKERNVMEEHIDSHLEENVLQVGFVIKC